MTSTEFVYTTYIKTTPEKVCAAITTSEFTRQYWALKSSPIAASRAGSSGIVGMYSFFSSGHGLPLPSPYTFPLWMMPGPLGSKANGQPPSNGLVSNCLTPAKSALMDCGDCVDHCGNSRHSEGKWLRNLWQCGRSSSCQVWAGDSYVAQ